MQKIFISAYCDIYYGMQNGRYLHISIYLYIYIYIDIYKCIYIGECMIIYLARNSLKGGMPAIIIPVYSAYMHGAAFQHVLSRWMYAFSQLQQ